MRQAILASSPDPRCFFPLFLILRTMSCSHVPEVVSLHSLFSFFIFLLFISFYSFIMKIKVAFLFSIRSAIRNTRFESGRRASYISCIRCKSSLSYSRANQDGVLDVPLSHLSLYTSSPFSPLLFPSTSSSLFRSSSERARYVWPDGIFPLYFPDPVHGYQIPSFPLLLLRCILRAHSYLLVFPRTVR